MLKLHLRSHCNFVSVNQLSLIFCFCIKFVKFSSLNCFTCFLQGFFITSIRFLIIDDTYIYVIWIMVDSWKTYHVSLFIYSKYIISISVKYIRSLRGKKYNPIISFTGNENHECILPEIIYWSLINTATY